MTTTLVRRAVAAAGPLLAALVAAVAATATASCSVPAKVAAPAQTAIVSLGDSFISGEAGRWLGNSDTFTGSRDGTDRAYNPVTGAYDPTQVYGSSYNNGCDRSDVAEIQQARTQVNADVAINLACSGATTDAIWNSFKGEDPQAAQLARVAKQYRVNLIVLSIGGNDLGISDILRACGEDFLTPLSKPCTADGSVQARIAAALPTVRAQIAKVIGYLQGTMSNAGYTPGSYRFVLQGYPSTLPDGSHVRYPETYDRYLTGGCPFYNTDLNWVRGQLTTEVNDMLAQTASPAGVDFLDLRDTLAGRELCSTTTNLVDPQHPVSLITSEWSRFVSEVEQGTEQEALHPNAIAQQALGYCLGLFVVGTPPGTRKKCENTPGQDYRGMRLV